MPIEMILLWKCEPCIDRCSGGLVRRSATGGSEPCPQRAGEPCDHLSCPLDMLCVSFALYCRALEASNARSSLDDSLHWYTLDLRGLSISLAAEDSPHQGLAQRRGLVHQ